jgi:uncharacterized membrane protein
VFLVGMASLCLVAPLRAQPSDTTTSAPPSRPVILPMTPGSTLGKSGTPTKAADRNTPRPRIIPTGSTAKSEAAPSGRSEKGSPDDYSFCNRTSYAVTVAVGIKHGGLLVTRGWWPINAGECKDVIKGPLTQQSYYTFARSSFAHTGAMRSWGGATNLCTGKGQFQATGDGNSQCGPGYETQGFAKVDTNGRSNWLTILKESDSIKNLEMARIAGLQRLLRDLGRFDGAIDGAAGPKFNEALSQARTELGSGSSDLAILYPKLLSEANRVQASTGFTLCNRTEKVIDAAFGRELQGKLVSRGWYRLQPGQCEKVIRERLAEPAVYAYAVESAPADPKVPEIWPGPRQFCTRDSQFEFDDASNCGGKGSTATGFVEVPTGGLPGIRHDFPSHSEPQ